MKVTVTLRHKDRTYTFVPDDCTYDEPYHALFMWTEGNFGCDCNKSLFIQSQCDEDFPDLDCGEEVALVSLVTDDGRTLYPEPDYSPQQMPVAITQRPSGIYIVTDA